MRYAVVGGDMRFAHLVSMLRESGRSTEGFFLEKAGIGEQSIEELGKSGVIISNWPLRLPLTDREADIEKILAGIAPGSTLLLCGPKFPAEKRRDLRYVNLWEDERLLKENAWLTAEAAVTLAAGRLGQGLRELHCGIIGYGRIGTALTEILLDIGARVRVFTGSATKTRQIEENGAEAVALSFLKEGIADRQLIFSTPPASVLDRAALECTRKDALIIDVASPPYGVDLDAAHDLGLHAWRENGLPGRYCPLSAARAIYHAILRWEEEEKNG